MFYYQAYGLILSSILPLPDLTPAGRQKPHVEIRWATKIEQHLLAGQPLPDNCEKLICQRISRKRAVLVWPTVGRAIVQHGRSIILEPLPEVSHDLLCMHLLDSGLAVLLQQRGLLPLPASVVAVGSSAVAFMKASDQSHRVIANSLHQTGLPLLADHIAAIDLNFEIPLLRPAYPDASPIAGLDSNPFLQMNDTFRHMVPLKGIYLLAEAEIIGIKPMTIRQVLPVFLLDWYGGRFGEGFLNWSEWVAHCRRCHQLAENVPSWRLNRPVAAGAGLEMDDLILDHILSPALQKIYP